MPKMRQSNPYLIESTRDLCRWKRTLKAELLSLEPPKNRRTKIQRAIKQIDDVLLERIENQNK